MSPISLILATNIALLQEKRVLLKKDIGGFKQLKIYKTPYSNSSKKKSRRNKKERTFLSDREFLSFSSNPSRTLVTRVTGGYNNRYTIRESTRRLELSSSQATLLDLMKCELRKSSIETTILQYCKTSKYMTV